MKLNNSAETSRWFDISTNEISMNVMLNSISSINRVGPLTQGLLIEVGWER